MKKDYFKDIKLEKLISKEEKVKKFNEKSKLFDSKGEKRKRKIEEKGVDKDFELFLMKIFKLEVIEMVKLLLKRKMEFDIEKMDRIFEKDKILLLIVLVKKIKFNREIGKKIGSIENIFSIKEFFEKLELIFSKVK